MPHIPNSSLKQIVKSIKDPGDRQALLDIINDDVVKEIYCKSETCKNRLIGRVHRNGAIREVYNENDEAYLRSSRDRLDGYKGFECWCGNDSRIAAQEEEHIKSNGNPPSKAGLEQIFVNVKSHPSNYPVKNAKQIIDGFEIREVA